VASLRVMDSDLDIARSATMRPIEAVARQFGVTQSDFRDERPQSVPQWQQCIPQWQQSVAQCCGM